MADMRNFYHRLDELNDKLDGLSLHENNVARLCYAMNTYAKMTDIVPEHESMVVFRAGLYHDIGKACVNKLYEGLMGMEGFGKNEFMKIKQHPLLGVQLLFLIASEEGIDFDNPLIRTYQNGILFHHERLNGSGYMGFSGDNIPHIARIIGVADCFSAGIERRVYEQPKTPEKVLSEIKEDCEKGLLDKKYYEYLYGAYKNNLFRLKGSEIILDNKLSTEICTKIASEFNIAL